MVLFLKFTHEQGQCLTHVKLTGGSIHVKEVIGMKSNDQIRLYNGENIH